MIPVTALQKFGGRISRKCDKEFSASGVKGQRRLKNGNLSEKFSNGGDIEFQLSRADVTLMINDGYTFFKSSKEIQLDAHPPAGTATPVLLILTLCISPARQW